MNNPTLKTAPSLEPLSLSEIKNYLQLVDIDGCNTINTIQSLSPASRAVGNYTGTSIEVLGYAATVRINAGVVSGTLTVKVQESNDNAIWTDYYTFTAITTSNDETAHSYSYNGSQRYIRAYATVATNTAVFAVDVDVIVGDTSQDEYIKSLIVAARRYCETLQNRAYITQVWEKALPDFPRNEILLEKGNIQTIDSITYRDYAGNVTTLSNTEYVTSIRGAYARIVPAYNKSWPSFTAYPLDAVIVTFTAGYGNTAASVPETVKQAMRLLIQHWYDNRMVVSVGASVSKEIDFSVTALLSQERIVMV